MNAISVPISYPEESRATGAYVAFLAFIVTVYSSAAQLLPPLEKLAPGKTVIAAAAMALLWACAFGRRPFRFAIGAGGLALYAFIGILGLSPLWSRWPGLSIESASESVKYLAGFVIAANVLDTRRRIRHAVAAIALASLFPAFGAIYSYLTHTNLVEGTRASWLGVFSNPNFLAYHLVVSVPLALMVREAAPSGPNRTLVRFGWLAVVAVLITGILLTGSRGGTLGLGAVLVVWLARSLVKGRIAVGAAAVVIVALLMTPTSPFAREATRSTLHGEIDDSAQGRLDAWRTAEQMVYANPILGVGAGVFVPSYDRYAPGDAGRARAAHNSFAMIAAELGIPALLVFCLAITGAMLALGRAAKRKNMGSLTPVARGLQIAIFGFVVCSMTGGYVFSWPIYFLMGIAAAVHIRAQAPAAR